MATPQAAQAFEGNIVTFPDTSAHPSFTASEASDVTPNETTATKWTTLENLVDRYQVSDRTIQNWLKRIVDQCQVSDSSLRIQRGQEVEFTSYCVELLDGLLAYRKVHGPKKIAGWFSNLAEKQQLQHQQHVAPEPEPESTPGELAVVPAHTEILPTIEQPEIFDLAILQDGTVSAYDDPMAIAQTFLSAADSVVGAMQSDIAQTETRLHQTKQARALIAQKAQDVKIETRLYQQHKRNLTAELGHESEQLQRDASILSGLGKGTGAEGRSPS